MTKVEMEAPTKRVTIMEGSPQKTNEVFQSQLADFLMVEERTWVAHSEDIVSVQWISETDSILSASSDRMVKLWTTTGICLGILRQDPNWRPPRGMEDTEDAAEWKFNLNIEERIRDQLKEVTRLEDEMKELPPRPELLEAMQLEAHRRALATRFTGHSAQSGDVDRSHLEASEKKDTSGVLDTRQETKFSRRTPRTKPISAMNAGKGFGARPRLR